MRSKYYKILSKERKEIKKRLKKERDPKVKLKLVLLNMVALGMSVKSVLYGDKVENRLLVDK